MAREKGLTGDIKLGGMRSLTIPGEWTIGARTAVMSVDLSQVAIEIERKAAEGRLTMRLYLTSEEGEALRSIIADAIDGARERNDPTTTRAERKAEREELLIQARKLAETASALETNDLIGDETQEFLHDFARALVEYFSKEEG